MKSTIQYIGVVLLTIMVFSCSFPNKEAKQNKELEKLALEVMEVHDRSMPNIEELMKLKKKLMSMTDSTITNPKDTMVRFECMQAALDLEKADDGMMEWMHTYKAPEDFLPFDEKKAYYIEQKKKIERVEVIMNQTMAKAKEMIAKYSHQ